MVAMKSKRYTRAWGLKSIVSTYSYAPESISCSASPRSVFKAVITEEIRVSYSHLDDEQRTLNRRRELVREHRVDDRLNVRWVWASRTIIDFRFPNGVIGSMTCLKDVQRSSHITLGESK